MSEHDGPLTILAEDLGLTDADVDRALAATHARGGTLLRRRLRRRAVIGGLGVVGLLAAGFGVLHSLGDDPRLVTTPAGGVESTEPSTPTSVVAPEGFDRRVDGNVVIYTNLLPSADEAGTATSTTPGGVAIGGGVSVERSAPIRSGTVISPGTLQLAIECEAGESVRLDRVAVHGEPDRLTVDAALSRGAGGEGCGADGTLRIDLPLPMSEAAFDGAVGHPVEAGPVDA